jgi:hypothetical protein
MKFKLKRQLSPLWDNTGFTLDRDGIQSVSEIVFPLKFVSPSWKDVMDVQTGVVNDRQIVIAGHFNGLAGRVKAGCDITPNPNGITNVEKTWSCKYIGDRFEECADDLKTTFWKRFLKSGADRYDLTGTEYATYVTERLIEYMSDDMMYRWIFFSNTAIAAGTNNNLTAPELEYFNALSGMFAQMDTVIASGATGALRKTAFTGTQNSSTTFAAQVFTAASSTSHEVTDLFALMYKAAPIELKSNPKAKWFVTQSVYDQYFDERAAVSAIPLAYDRVESGQGARGGLEYKGIQVVAMPGWDRLIVRHFPRTDNLSSFNPHRIVLIATDNWSVGTNNVNDFTDLKVFYSEYHHKLVIEFEFSFDAKLFDDTQFQYAY